MNIFEKYGSYEAVKQAAINYENSGDRVTAAGLELQCLEYRRQHNIFEVGDLITVAWDKSQLFVIKSIPVDGLIAAKDMSGKDVGNATFSQIRHATDAEIKAGKRLLDKSPNKPQHPYPHSNPIQSTTE